MQFGRTVECYQVETLQEIEDLPLITVHLQIDLTELVEYSSVDQFQTT